MILKFVMRDTSDVIVEGTPTVTADGEALTPTGTSALWQVDAPLGAYVVATLTGAVMREWQTPTTDAATIKTAMEAAGGSIALIKTATVTDIPAAIAAIPAAVSALATTGLAALRTLILGVPTAVVAAQTPTAGVTITPTTVGTDGLAIGQVMPYGKITAWLNGVAEWRFDADADGDFEYTLPAGSVWTLIAKAPAGDYEDAVAEVSTVDVS